MTAAIFFSKLSIVKILSNILSFRRCKSSVDFYFYEEDLVTVTVQIRFNFPAFTLLIIFYLKTFEYAVYLLGEIRYGRKFSDTLQYVLAVRGDSANTSTIKYLSLFEWFALNYFILLCFSI